MYYWLAYYGEREVGKAGRNIEMPPLRSAVVSVPVVGGRKEALSPGLRRARVVPIS